ncbi:MAG: hypothetical protein H7Y43_07540 [Akkermansiaceae bacterium]|nr:hypothetical protein [Verrucomicrobiales bacterium]
MAVQPASFLCQLVALVLIMGCGANPTKQQHQPQARSCRSVRVSFINDGASFVARVNEGEILRRSISEFTNWTSVLNLDYGDVVLWQAQRDKSGKELSIPDNVHTWFQNYLVSHKASWYWLNDDNGDIFKLPIFHWKAPFENLRSVTNASFYIDGRALGNGAEGFHNMVNTILTKKPKMVLIFGSRLTEIDNDPELGWAEQANVLKEFEKIEFGWRGHLLDFSRLLK